MEKKHLGAALGSEEFKQEFVSSKVDTWVSEITQLAEIAKQEPQAAYAAFTQRLRHRWTYVMRTVADISQLLHPMEEAIKTIFIPALVGQNVNEDERALISLPPRLGGLGIVKPQEMCDAEYTNSKTLTEQLTSFIITQNVDGEIDKDKLKKSKQEIRLQRRQHQEGILENLKGKMEPDKLRLLEASLEKGASNWLSCLPLTDYGFNINKQEFCDSLKL